MPLLHGDAPDITVGKMTLDKLRTEFGMPIPAEAQDPAKASLGALRKEIALIRQAQDIFNFTQLGTFPGESGRGFPSVPGGKTWLVKSFADQLRRGERPPIHGEVEEPAAAGPAGGEAGATPATAEEHRTIRRERQRIPKSAEILNPPGNLTWDEQRKYQLAQKAQVLTDEPKLLFHHAGPGRGAKDVIAELGPGHEMAMAKVQDDMRARANSDLMKIAQQQVTAASQISAPEVLESYLGHGNADEYIDQYMQKFDKRIISPLREEAQENWFERTLPQINAQFAGSGATHGGQRLKMVERSARDTQKDLGRETSKLRQQAEERARDELHRQAQRNLQTGELATTVLQREKQNAWNAAQTAAGVRGAEQQETMLDVQAMRDLAHTEAVRKQQIINEQIRRHEEEETEPLMALETERRISEGGAPITGTFGPLPMMPTAPNPMLAGAGIFNQMLGMGMRGGNKKRGGHIKGYANGGNVVDAGLGIGDSDFVPYSDANLPAFNSPEMRQVRNTQYMSHGNPQAARFEEMGRHLLGAAASGANASPLGAYSAALGAGEDVYQKRVADENVNRQRAANLAHAVNNSRLDQQKLLNQARRDRKNFDETKRMHDSQIEMNRAHAAHYRSQAGGKNQPQPINIGGVEINPARKIGLTPQDRMQLKQNEKIKQEYVDKSKGYNHMVELLNKAEATGDLPSTGVIAEYTPNISSKSREYKRTLNEMVQGEVPSGMMTGQKLEFAEGLKPTERDPIIKVKPFAQRGADLYKNKIDKIDIEEAFAAYDIPTRISGAAYERWVTDGKKGDIVDYVKGILEGTLPMTNNDNSNAVTKADEAQEEAVLEADIGALEQRLQALEGKKAA